MAGSDVVVGPCPCAPPLTVLAFPGAKTPSVRSDPQCTFGDLFPALTRDRPNPIARICPLHLGLPICQDLSSPPLAQPVHHPRTFPARHASERSVHHEPRPTFPERRSRHNPAEFEPGLRPSPQESPRPQDLRRGSSVEIYENRSASAPPDLLLPNGYDTKRHTPDRRLSRGI